MDRRELTFMSDTELQVAADGYRNGLWSAWNKYQPGSLNDAWAWALCLTEASLRGISLRPILRGQETLDV